MSTGAAFGALRLPRYRSVAIPPKKQATASIKTSNARRVNCGRGMGSLCVSHDQRARDRRVIEDAVASHQQVIPARHGTHDFGMGGIETEETSLRGHGANHNRGLSGADNIESDEPLGSFSMSTLNEPGAGHGVFGFGDFAGPLIGHAEGREAEGVLRFQLADL